MAARRGARRWRVFNLPVGNGDEQLQRRLSLLLAGDGIEPATAHDLPSCTAYKLACLQVRLQPAWLMAGNFAVIWPIAGSVAAKYQY